MTATSSSTDKYFVIVAYDIVSNKRRRRVMKKLKGMGFHVQKSVFECFLDDSQIDRLRLEMQREIDADRDTVRIYKMPSQFTTEVEIIGIGELAADLPLIIV